MIERAKGISVVIPTYDRRDEVLRAVDSVVSARPSSVEIIVIDDASREDARDYIGPVNRAGIVTRVYRHDRNRGPQVARNLGIRRAHFDFIAFLDSDDEFAAGKIDSIFARLASGDVDIVLHAVSGAGRYNTLLRLWHRRFSWLSLYWYLSLFNPVPSMAMVVRRGSLLMPPRLRYCEDYAYLLHYCRPRTRVAILDVELTRIHRTPGAAGGLSAARWRMRQGEFAARQVLLRDGGMANMVRFAIGTAAGLARVAADLIRGRYFVWSAS